MDDLAHQCPRKRKQDQDDVQEPSRTDQAVVSADGPSVVSNAPRQQWLAETDDNLWTSPTSPQVSSPLTLRATKRPRIDTHENTLRAKRYPRRSPNKITPTIRHGSDIEDIGIVNTAHPGPSSGSLLRPRAPILPGVAPPRVAHILSTAADSPIKFNSPHIPPTQSLINRQTLKELELDIILRNPVIRHDLLFDPGLQFRPRRKRDMFEKYWAAVWEEVQTGCTCVTLDVYGKSHPTSCVCSRHPTPPPIPIVSQISRETPHIYTLRLPSRIPALLTEFLEVMLFVIQPLSNTAVYTNPNAVKEQAQEHSAHAAYLRSIFDPALIEQELRHKAFDPSGLFLRIGETLKHHCAPMRDRAVEEMVQVAQQPGPEAFKAVRMCLELLELMKLDIANHQLTQLRPWLLRNTGIFEIKAFKIRFGVDASLHLTRQWLDNAHNALCERKTSLIPHPSFPKGLNYNSMTKNQQIYMCCLKGIVDLVFDASYLAVPEPPTAGNNASTPPESPICTSTTANTPTTALTPTHTFTLAHTPTSARGISVNALQSIPETLYLDKARMALISTDALDATALYMFALLFRQLVFADAPPAVKIEQADVMRLKREIRDIGPPALGVCFVAPESESESIVEGSGGEELTLGYSDDTNKYKQRRSNKQDLVLQVATRASHLRQRGTSTTTTAETTPASSSSTSAPDQATLTLAQRWADANMKPGSQLSLLLHKRVRDAVFAEVVGIAYPSGAAAAAVGPGAGAFLFGANGCASTAFGQSNKGSRATSTANTNGSAAGMEALGEEIHRLGEKIARLALIHLNTHLPMYESEGFLRL